MRYLVTDTSHAEALAACAAESGCMKSAEPTERELRSELAPLVAADLLEPAPHDGWLASPTDLAAAQQRGACPSFLGADRPLPPCYWGVRSGLACLDPVVADVWREGWSHHITRLMVLANLATLLDVDPRELTDWFWVAYTDAFDWVVEPNVLAMGTFAVGPLMTTKPYVAGAAYIHRMSDYCSNCVFDPRRNCPITRLYWAFLDRHRDRLVDNPRMGMMLRALARRLPAAIQEDRRVFALACELLGRGDALLPERLGG